MWGVDSPARLAWAASRRELRRLELLGWVAVAADVLVPRFGGYQALLTGGFTPPHLHLGLAATLLILRWWRVAGMPRGLVRAASVCVGGLLLLFVGQLLVLTPLLQGRGVVEDSFVGQVQRVEGEGMDLRLEDGTTRHAVAADAGALAGVSAGQCLTVDLLRGRTGVRWIAFAPRTTLGQRTLLRGRCLDPA